MAHSKDFFTLEAALARIQESEMSNELKIAKLQDLSTALRNVAVVLDRSYQKRAAMVFGLSGAVLMFLKI